MQNFASHLPRGRFNRRTRHVPFLRIIGTIPRSISALLPRCPSKRNRSVPSRNGTRRRGLPLEVEIWLVATVPPRGLVPAPFAFEASTVI